jgi:MinD-like ATPase involved in chromosome partitioning or flagellar assembly
VGVGDDDRCRALGITASGRPGALAQAIASAGHPGGEAVVDRDDARTIAVWGTSGAPGRSTVAASLAAGMANLGVETVLVDADVHGGSIAQMLAMLDEVSGLMAACRAANRGRVDETTDHLLEVEERLRLLSGIPRADLWSQVRPGALDLVLRWLRSDADAIVVDCAAPIEPGEGGSGPGRNQVTRMVLSAADEVLVVGRADPVGLSRLVRALHDLSDLETGAPTVIVNQMRPSLGWSEREVADTLERLTGVVPTAFLPADVEALDVAMMRGRLPRSAVPSSPFVAAMDDVVGSLAPMVRSSLST